MSKGAYLLREDKFEALMRLRGISSKAEFCRLSGVSRSCLDDIRTGRRSLNMTTVARMLRMFDNAVDFDGLFTTNPAFELELAREFRARSLAA